MTERPRLMNQDDYTLSMRISPRARRSEDNEGLRTLLVLRLSDTQKAVARLSLREGHVSVLCEPCGIWQPAPHDEFPLEWRCNQCERLYAMEFAVLEEVNDDKEVEEVGGNDEVA